LTGALPAVATTITWAFVFNPKYGYLNAVYTALLGGDGPDWFMQHTLGCLIMIAVWGFGNTMMIFLAGLQEVPKSLVEAATVDGANAWSRYIRITLPLLRRTFALVLILTTIGSFLAFEQFFIMTSGGPRQKTLTVVYKIFVEAFQSFEMGDAAALSMVLLVILLFLSYLQLRLLRDDTRF